MKISFKLLLLMLLFVILACSYEVDTEGSYKSYRYYRIDGEVLEINLKSKIVLEGSGVNSLSNCNIDGFRKCFIFDSTIIAIPRESVLPSGSFEKYSSGNVLGGRLKYNITKTELDLGGNNYSGFFITIGERPKLIDEGKVYGSYFYSLEHGVLIFEHYDYVSDDYTKIGDNLFLISRTLWSDEGIR